MHRNALLLLFLLAEVSPAQHPKPLPGSEACEDCHQEGGGPGRREAGVPPVFDASGLRASPHAEFECVACHADVDPASLPHADKLGKVDCGGCHPVQANQYAESLHGKAARLGDKLAPSCGHCHGAHNVLRSSDPKSATATLEIPRLCGACHHEGSPVSLTHDIPQSSILENYSESIHGEGLLKRGLIVTAVCTSCHTAHFVLPHTDSRSSISQRNIAQTCTKCHAQIESVHQKVIRGELWEKQPHVIPACVDCHEPHKVRRVFYAQGMADRDCLRCHGNPELIIQRGGQTISLSVQAAASPLPKTGLARPWSRKSIARFAMLKSSICTAKARMDNWRPRAVRMRLYAVTATVRTARWASTKPIRLRIPATSLTCARSAIARARRRL